MKTIILTATLLIAVASAGAHAQSGGNSRRTPGRYPTPTAEGPSSTTTGAQSTRSQSGSASTGTKASTGNKSGGTSAGQKSPSQSSKSGPKNQQGAGVPSSGSASDLRTGKPDKTP
ncbi:hypothetical protein [Spirosoma validum]|uniref:Uncharacterized protein n=1 Tax=Spirosoma validum TaxID=2771355 RepID=A0A927B7V6_9BACT|nr:hypothetical protein [Spirosoma validum]MBD2756762.1 hypothetical protein [Spirosoma validum]